MVGREGCIANEDCIDWCLCYTGLSPTAHRHRLRRPLVGYEPTCLPYIARYLVRSDPGYQTIYKHRIDIGMW